MRVRIELQDITCHSAADACDAFYIVSAFYVLPTITQVGLTTPMDIHQHETTRFADQERILFDAELASDQSIQGGMVAFNARFPHDQSKRASWINGIKAHVQKTLPMSTVVTTNTTHARTTTAISPVNAATVLAMAIHGWYLVAPTLEQNDELGQLTLDTIPAQGPATEDAAWNFKWVRSTWSHWGYAVNYHILRS